MEFQRQNHEWACRELQIRNPRVPKAPGMLRKGALIFWQLVAAKATRDFRKDPLLIGGILADSVGPGKIWSVCAYLLSELNEHNAVDVHKPALV